MILRSMDLSSLCQLRLLSHTHYSTPKTLFLCKLNTIIFPAIPLECSTKETVFIDIVFLHLRADYLSKLM